MDKQKGKHVGNSLEQTTRIIKLKFSQLFKAHKADITPEQWIVLDCLAEKDGITQATIVTRTFKDAPTISRIINNLSKKGLTQRKESLDDRRKYQINLTSKGRALIKRLTPEVEKLRAEGWLGLSQSDYNEFKRIVETIFKNYKE